MTATAWSTHGSSLSLCSPSLLPKPETVLWPPAYLQSSCCSLSHQPAWMATSCIIQAGSHPGWTHPTQQLPSSNSPVVCKRPLGHWADLRYLCFPDGLRALRELISPLAVPVEGAEIKTRTFFIQSQQINWQKRQKDNLDSVESLLKGYPAEACWKQI